MNLGFVHLCVLLCRWVRAALRSTHRIEDVNVNTASQRKGMCEARKKPWGQCPEEDGRAEGRKEGKEKRVGKEKGV